MKKPYLLSLALLFSLPVCLSAQVTINETNFPDENFRAYVLENYDFDKDALLSEEEIARRTNINVSGKGISSLKGIEHFTAVTTLSCSYNKLTTLDVSGCPALAKLMCYDNQLKTLNVSQNTALTELECYNNQLTALDVSYNTALTVLICYSNLLTSLDVSHNTALTYLDCWDNQLTTLNVSQNTALKELYCSNNQLNTLDINHNTALIRLKCGDNKLRTLDVSQNTTLKDLACGVNQLTSLDVSQNTTLTGLVCDNNQLTALDVSQNTALTSLWCDNNHLTALDVHLNTAVTDLYCNNNQLTSIDISNNTKLTNFSCENNRREVKVGEDRKFELYTLHGFDRTRADNWSGGSVNAYGDTLTFTADSVTYAYTTQYSGSNSIPEKIIFKLVAVVNHTPDPEPTPEPEKKDTVYIIVHDTIFLDMNDPSRVLESGGIPDISIYPNPSHGNITVVVPEKVLLEVFNTEGRKVYRQDLPAGTYSRYISVSGTYYARFSSNGRATIKKVVIL